MQGDDNGLKWEHLQEVLTRYGQRAVELYRANLTESGRPASGALAESLHTEVIVGDRAIGVDFHVLDYWKYIEHGTRPHWAPIAPLREWVEVKPLLPRPLANGKLPTPTQLAYMVQHKIAREGTQGKDDLGRALQETWDTFARDVSEAVTADIEESLDWVLSYLLVP